MKSQEKIPLQRTESIGIRFRQGFGGDHKGIDDFNFTDFLGSAKVFSKQIPAIRRLGGGDN
jgi:hypothetical protein